MRYCTAYVGGPDNTGGDFYLNGHRDLTKGFNTIMHPTVGFMLASTHRRLSFYGGMLPIPGLTARMLQGHFVRGAYDAARGERNAPAMRTCEAALKGKRRVSELERKCAQSIYDYVDRSSIAPAFERARRVLAGEDKFRGYEVLQKLARSVKGLDEYEAKAQNLLKSLGAEEMQVYLAGGCDARCSAGRGARRQAIGSMSPESTAGSASSQDDSTGCPGQRKEDDPAAVPAPVCSH